MRRLAAVILTLAFPLLACSVEESPQGTSQTTSEVQQAAVAPAPPTPAPREARPAAEKRVAQAAPATEPAANAEGSPRFVAGTHYRVLTPAQPTSSSPDQIEVAEFFMHTCPHCFNFEPHIETWLRSKPAHVNFVRIPANFNKTARMHAYAYYALEAMGKAEAVHPALFRELHVSRNPLNTEAALTKFVAEQGVDPDEFVQTMGSFAVDTKVRQADTLARRYGVSSVPIMIVNGKYVTNGSMAGSYPKLMEIIDYLVAKEAARE